MLHTALAVAAALVGLAFTLSTLDRWLSGHKRHELAWTFAFAFFTLAAAFLAAGSTAGWNSVIFRGFFLFGAIINVPLLALGSLLLLTKPRNGNIAIAVTAGFALFATGVIMSTPLLAPLPKDQLAQGSAVFGLLPRILAAVGSGAGALIVFSGSVMSAWRRPQKRNIVGNALIAGGTAILGMSGLLNSVADAMTGFAITLVMGISLIFAGFLSMTARPKPSAKHDSYVATLRPPASPSIKGVQTT